MNTSAVMTGQTLIHNLLSIALDRLNSDAVTILRADPISGHFFHSDYSSFSTEHSCRTVTGDEAEAEDSPFYRNVLASSMPAQTRDKTNNKTILSIPAGDSNSAILLNFIRFSNKPFSAAEKDDGLTFAAMIAQCICDNSGRFEGDRGSYRALLELSRTITEKIEFEQALNSFCGAVSGRMGVSQVAILRYSARDKKFEVVFGFGIEKDRFDWIRDSMRHSLMMPVGEGDSAHLLFDDDGEKKILSFINLACERKNVGILALIGSESRSGAVTKSDLLFLKAVAAQLAALIERHRLYEELENEKNKLSSLNDINLRIVQAGLDEHRILESILPCLKKNFGAATAGIHFVATRATRGSKALTIIKSEEKLCAAERSQLETMLSESINSMGTPVWISRDGRIAMVALTTGVLMLCAPESQSLCLLDRHLLDLIAGELSIVLENVVLFREHEMLAYTDALTGVFNHRYFQETLEKEFQRSRRYDLPLSLLIMDIDHFKAFNDTYGHLTGDMVLAGVAGLLKTNVRDIDTVARYGGEEFVAVLPQTSLEAALEIAERIRSACEARAFSFPDIEHALHVTLSIGISQFNSDLSDRNALILLADQALYHSKDKGRNMVSVHDGQKACAINYVV